MLLIRVFSFSSLLGTVQRGAFVYRSRSNRSRSHLHIPLSGTSLDILLHCPNSAILTVKDDTFLGHMFTSSHGWCGKLFVAWTKQMDSSKRSVIPTQTACWTILHSICDLFCSNFRTLCVSLFQTRSGASSGTLCLSACAQTSLPV